MTAGLTPVTIKVIVIGIQLPSLVERKWKRWRRTRWEKMMHTRENSKNWTVCWSTLRTYWGSPCWQEPETGSSLRADSVRQIIDKVSQGTVPQQLSSPLDLYPSLCLLSDNKKLNILSIRPETHVKLGKQDRFHLFHLFEPFKTMKTWLLSFRDLSFSIYLQH